MDRWVVSSVRGGIERVFGVGDGDDVPGDIDLDRWCWGDDLLV